MQKNTIRFISIFCFLFLSFLCMAKEPAAPFLVVRDSITYELDPNTRTAKLVDGKKSSGHFIIPNMVKEKGKKYQVVSIADSSFYENDNLKSVYVGESVKYVGASSFYACSLLDSVVFADNTQLDTICPYAFAKCDSLSCLKLPKQFISIGEGAVSDYRKLLDVSFNSIYRNIFPQSYLCHDYSSYEKIRISDTQYLKMVFAGNVDAFLFLCNQNEKQSVISDSLFIESIFTFQTEEKLASVTPVQLYAMDDSTTIVELSIMTIFETMSDSVKISSERTQKLFLMVRGGSLYKMAHDPVATLVQTSVTDSGDSYYSKLEIVYTITGKKTNGFYDLLMAPKTLDCENCKEISEPVYTQYYNGKEYVLRCGY